MINLNAEIRLPAKAERYLARLSFSSKVRERFWRKLASQQRHNMPLDESLLLFAKQARARKSLHERCYLDIRDRLALGKDIGNALYGYASAEEILLISSSQKGGNLPEGLMLASELIVAKRKIIGAVVNALAYPAVLIGVLVAFLYVIGTVVMPQLTAITDPTRWQGPALALYRVSQLVNSPYGIVCLAGFLASIFLAVFSFPRWTGQGRYWADKCPPWSIYRLLVGVSWLHTVATLMFAGRKLIEILDAMLKDRSSTPYLRWVLRRIQIYAARGANLGDALLATKLQWPAPALIDELQTYAALPGFNAQLRSIAADWLDEGIEMIIRAARGLNVFCTILVGLLVILMVAGVSSIQQQIATGLGV